MNFAKARVMGEDAVALYPRALRPKERDLLESVLPGDRRGYLACRNMISTMVVIGEGRRGEGNVVLGMAGDRPDLSSPLGPVIAYGAVETTRDVFSVSVRELAGNQIDVDIVSSHGGALPDHYEERRRWSYSTWLPGAPSPDTGERAREVRISEGVVLALFNKERRLLVYDAGSGMNHLIPVTTLYNELMIVRKIRDPRIALHSGLLFEGGPSFTDGELRAALVAYNRQKRRISIPDLPASPEPEKGIRMLMSKLLRKGRS